MKKLFILLSIVSFSYTTKAQVGIGTTTPQATLDIRETNAGSPTAYAGIAVPQVNVLPALGNRAGQLIYLTTTNSYYYYNGSTWSSLSSQTNTLGDLKHGFQTADHSGWVLLNGRAKTTLTTTQQTAATALGIGTNLPDATDKFIKGKNAEILASTTGSNSASVSIIQANLPNVSMSGSTVSDGAHAHTASAANESSHTHTANSSAANESSHTHSYDNYSSTTFALPGLGLLSTSGLTPTTSGTKTTSAGTAHNHTITVGAGTAHNHAITVDSGGIHTHTVSVNTGGSGTALSVPTVPSSIVANTFIYLGN